MRVNEGALELSVRDIAQASMCQWRFIRHAVRALSGDSQPIDTLIGEHVARLSERYALDVLDHYYQAVGRRTPRYPYGVLDADAKPAEWAGRALASGGVPGFADAHDATVIFGERLECDGLYGTVPLAVMTGDGPQIQLPRFSSHVRLAARVEVGGYARLLERCGAGTPAPTSLVLLASGRVVPVPTAEAVADFDRFAAELRPLVRRIAADDVPDWWEASPICGGCPECEVAIAAHDDILAVPGIGQGLRDDLAREGVRTRRDLVEARPREVPPDSLELAELQLAQRDLRPGPYGPQVVVRVDSRHPLLQALPEPAPGDIYLDFENDSLWQWTRSDHTGLIYLAGLAMRAEDGPPPAAGTVWAPPGTPAPTESCPAPAWEHAPVTPPAAGGLARATGWRYVSWWAHSRADEAALIRGLLTWLEDRRRRYPQMRLYHYSKQEPLYLRRLARRHAMDMGRIDRLCGRGGICTDLFTVVSAAVKTGQPGQSLKDLEPLYMGPWRRGEVNDGAASVVLYDQARDALEVGDLAHRARPGSHGISPVLAELAAYNEFDCVSTMLLHRWLLAQRAAHA
ncbi:MAG: ribonuclease H-like domain-containing protein [Actinomycetaceae bacterium]|nr:ribonuclease H-like domain-containing protein [Actinomycetaceae bacterium]MDU0969984.1 ribonuclease H-like domain-containing protein [Actinomycetaceae bacterium]